MYVNSLTDNDNTINIERPGEKLFGDKHNSVSFAISSFYAIAFLDLSMS